MLRSIAIGLFIGICVLGSVATAQAQSTWYVTPFPAGNDANPGDPMLPFATIQHGIAHGFDDTVLRVTTEHQQLIECVLYGFRGIRHAGC